MALARVRYSLTEHIAHSILLSKYNSESELAMFTAYFDVSGASDTTVLTMAGYVSDAKKWAKFECRWQEILDRENIKSFHMTDCVSGKSHEYKGWTPERKRQFINDLAECARKYTNKRFSASVIIEDYGRVDAIYQLREYLGDPYTLCGTSCVAHVRTWAINRKLKTPPLFVFEAGDKREGNFVHLCEKQFGITPLFYPKKDLLPLQAADLAAWKTRHPIREAVGDKPYTQQQFEKLLYHTRTWLKEPHAGGGFDYTSLMKVCKGNPIPRR